MIRVMGLVAVLLSVRVAAAQPVDFTSLRLHGSSVIYVTDRAGDTFKGKVTRLTPSQLEIYDGKSLRLFGVNSVTRVRGNDSLKNGMLIGGSIGVAAGVVGHGFTDCQFDPHCARGSRRLMFGPLGLAAWVAIGAVVDAVVPGPRQIWP
ncbi:MAG: hypothetical protein ND807_16485 [Vicinamibacterales bacterium]|nr:hypothetical protein [Vicinamibacterales bacterium]